MQLTLSFNYHRCIFPYLLHFFGNSDFKEGETSFYATAPGNDASNHHRLSQAKKVLVPRAGTCVMFTHDVEHEGLPPVAGAKYILR